MPETTATDPTVEPSTHVAGETKPAELVVRYRYAYGVLIEGKTQPYRNELKRARPRWMWFPAQRRWGMPRTRERVLSSDQVEEYARGLRAAGVPNVRVDYLEPQPETAPEFDGADGVVEALGERAVDGDEQPDGPAAWLDRVKPITAGHFIRWFPPSYRNAMALVDGVRARHELGPAPGPKSVLPYARAARNAVEGTAEWRSEELRELLDPTYPSYRAPKVVRPRLRRPAPAVQRVLDVLGIDCGWEDEAISARDDDDGVAPEILGERAARRAAAERARREHEVAFHAVDARALLVVCREAASFGEVTPGRFNAAYQRLHPVFDGATRGKRALVLIDQGGRLEAKVRGPHGVEFSVSRPARTEERAVVAALMYRLDLVAEASTGRPKTRKVDRNPTNKKGTHGPNVDANALTRERGEHATSKHAEPEVTREIERLVSGSFEESMHEAADAVPGSEEQEDTGATGEGHSTGEPLETAERAIEEGWAGPEPQGEGLEQVVIALAAGPGEDTGVHAPAEHSALFARCGRAIPAVLELAEYTSRRCPPDKSVPPLPQAWGEAPPSPAEDDAPPTAGDQPSPQGATPCRSPPNRRAPIARLAGSKRARQARLCGLGPRARQPSTGPPPTRHRGGGQARRVRDPPSPRRHSRVGPRNRGPPPHSRQ